MRITAASARVEDFGLTRPYTIAFRSVDSVTNLIVELVGEGGLIGLGAASPEPFVTGEDLDDCRKALCEKGLDWLVGRDVRELPAHVRELEKRMPKAPAARAAVDIALHDLLARRLDVPLVRMLGRVHDALPTSITIGIKPVDEAVAEAREYLDRGFRVLKVKLGNSLEEDLERLHRLRETVGEDVAIRVDPNQGYTGADVKRFVLETANIDIEFLEQPLPVEDTDSLRSLPVDVRARVMADESLLSPEDALRLIAPPRACGIFNIKLMKCGGVLPGLRIASIAEAAGVELMWGCMDESIISITAALHAAFASSATRYLDLDGSLDLARDVVAGGFVLDQGMMRVSDAPGLGVTPLR